MILNGDRELECWHDGFKAGYLQAQKDECERAAKVAEQYDNYTVDGRTSWVGAVIATAIRGMDLETPALPPPEHEASR